MSADRHNQDVPSKLAQAARVREARMLPVAGRLTEEQRDAVREDVAGYITKRELGLDDVADDIGLRKGDVERFLNDGAGDRRTRQFNDWLNDRLRRDDPQLPRGMVSTTVTERMVGVVKATSQHGTMGLIIGPAGVGKSLVLKACESGLVPGCVHVECHSGTRNPRPFASWLARQVSTKGRIGSTIPHGTQRAMSHLVGDLIDRLRVHRRVLLIDEAHYLTKAALNITRDIHKQAGVPVVLVGSRDVAETLNDFTEFHGQFGSLFTYTYNVGEAQASRGRPLYSVDEVARFAASMDIKLTKRGAIRLTELGCILGWGGLRRVQQVLLNARVMADEGQSIDDVLVKRAMRDMLGSDEFDRVEWHREQTLLKVKVA